MTAYTHRVIALPEGSMLVIAASAPRELGHRAGGTASTFRIHHEIDGDMILSPKRGEAIRVPGNAAQWVAHILLGCGTPDLPMQESAHDDRVYINEASPVQDDTTP